MFSAAYPGDLKSKCFVLVSLPASPRTPASTSEHYATDFSVTLIRGHLVFAYGSCVEPARSRYAVCITDCLEPRQKHRKQVPATPPRDARSDFIQPPSREKLMAGALNIAAAQLIRLGRYARERTYDLRPAKMLNRYRKRRKVLNSAMVICQLDQV